MVASPDFQDFTQGSSRLRQQAAESPFVSAAAGWHTQAFTIPAWASSATILITRPANVALLWVNGNTSGFRYLDATPCFDGGIYYLPVLPVVDALITLQWYQVDAGSCSFNVVLSDEPLSIGVFNPIQPATATFEHTLAGSPFTVGAGATVTQVFALDFNTYAVRCSAQPASNVLWSTITGVQSGKVYYDSSTFNEMWPTTPIPVDPTADSTISVAVHGGVGGTSQNYVTALNGPDSSAGAGISRAMAADTLAPDPSISFRPNQQPAIFDGTIAAGAVQSLVATTAGRQLRVHAINIMQWSAATSDFDLEDTNGNKFFHYHWPATTNAIYVPLFGQLAANGAGLQLRNLLAGVTATLAITLWYSVL